MIEEAPFQKPTLEVAALCWVAQMHGFLHKTCKQIEVADQEFPARSDLLGLSSDAAASNCVASTTTALLSACSALRPTRCFL